MITQEMIEAAMSKLHKGAAITEAEMGNALTAALALLPGEPAAVMWVDSTGCEHVTTDVDRGKAAAAAWGYDIRPLYTSPTPHPNLDR